MIPKMKSIKEVLIIVIVAIVLGIGYNYFGGKKLPMVYEKPHYNATSDSELFGDDSKPSNGLVNPLLAPTQNDTQITSTEDSKPDSTKKQSTTNLGTEKNAVPPNDGNKNTVSTEESRTAEKLKTDASKSNDQKAKVVTYEQILKIIDDPHFLLVDARHSEAWQKDRIGHSLNIYPYDDEEAVFHKILDLPMNKKLVVYCDGGTCDASHKLADMMQSAGYTNVYIYIGGWDEWIKKRGMK